MYMGTLTFSSRVLKRMSQFVIMILRRGKIRSYILLLTVIVVSILILCILFNEKETEIKNVTFNLNNIPYSQLKNGSCTQTNNQWNCPDIRSEGLDTLRQTQLVLIRMFLVFDALAKKYNLSYWITRGTLLGAARHQGFIPWDIDLDIEIPIEDYLRFLQKGADELPSDMFLQRHEKEQSLSKTKKTTSADIDLHKLNYAVLSPWNPRIRDEKSCYMTCSIKKCKWHDGLMVDVYPVMLRDGYYLDQFSLITRVFRFFGINHGTWYKAYPLVQLVFEGIKVPVPFEWRKQLKVLYGESYMKLPSKNKQYPPDGTIPEPNIACPRV